MKILMVLTSHDQLGNTGKKTGFWLEEFAAPYYAFKDAGAEITLVSPAGGQPPLDPKAMSPVRRPPKPTGSARTLQRNWHWPIPGAWPRSALTILMPCFIPVDMARCGIWLKTSIPSP